STIDIDRFWSAVTCHRLRSPVKKKRRQVVALQISFRADSVEKDIHDDIGHRFKLVMAMRDDPIRRHFIQRTEENFGNDFCVKVFAKDVRALSFFKNLAQQIEILSKAGR